jgi:hypothetical protein
MKKQILVASLLLTFLAVGSTAQQAMAAAKKNADKPQGRAQLGTSFRFNPDALRGKRQASPNLTATVENDKYLDDLLAPRKSFRDRIEQDKQRN